MKAATMSKLTALTALLTVGLPAFADCPEFDDDGLHDSEWMCRAILPMDNLDVSATCDSTVTTDSDSDGETFHYEGDPALPNAALADPDRQVWVRWTISDLYSDLHTGATPSPGDLAAYGRVSADFVYSGSTYSSARSRASLSSGLSPRTKTIAEGRSQRCHELPAGVTDIGLFEMDVETAVYATCSTTVDAEASADIMMTINPQLCWQR